jgi:hypothetical protein
LASYEKKLHLLRDHVVAVALGYATGLVLWGPPGVSKSYTVTQELDRLTANYILSNSHITGYGLFKKLQMYPDAIHLIEDNEQLGHDKNAVGVLRSALWGQRPLGDTGPVERWVTWAADGEYAKILFTGGVILVSNEPLLDRPALQAVKSRVRSMCLQPTNDEVRALMRAIATRGYEHENGERIDAEECMRICEFVIAQYLSLQQPLNLRMLIKAFSLYLQWEEGHATVDWRDAVAADVRDRPTWFRHELSLCSRAERKRRELEIAREILGQTEEAVERQRLWLLRTGKSPASFYRRCEDLRRG